MYSYEAIVRYSETGGNKISNMATIANYFQDCAILQSEEVGRTPQSMVPGFLADRGGQISCDGREDQGQDVGI